MKQIFGSGAGIKKAAAYIGLRLTAGEGAQ